MSLNHTCITYFHFAFSRKAYFRNSLPSNYVSIDPKAQKYVAQQKCVLFMVTWFAKREGCEAEAMASRAKWKKKMIWWWWCVERWRDTHTHRDRGRDKRNRHKHTPPSQYAPLNICRNWSDVHQMLKFPLNKLESGKNGIKDTNRAAYLIRSCKLLSFQIPGGEGETIMSQWAEHLNLKLYHIRNKRSLVLNAIEESRRENLFSNKASDKHLDVLESNRRFCEPLTEQKTTIAEKFLCSYRRAVDVQCSSLHLSLRIMLLHILDLVF